MHVRPAEPRDDQVLADLFVEYGQAFAYEVGDQDLAVEGMRAREAYRSGALLVAEDAGGAVLGCVAFEPWGEGRARMKRMFVAPEHRGKGVGCVLAESIVAAARDAGHGVMVLDTSQSMKAARALYRGMGFAPFEADYEAPCRDVAYLALKL